MVCKRERAQCTLPPPVQQLAKVIPHLSPAYRATHLSPGVKATRLSPGIWATPLGLGVRATHHSLLVRVILHWATQLQLAVRDTHLKAIRRQRVARATRPNPVTQTLLVPQVVDTPAL